MDFMSFLTGILFTLCIEAVAWKIYTSRERKKARAAYIPPRPNPRDYPDKEAP